MPIFEGVFDIVFIVFLPKLSVVSLFSKKQKKIVCICFCGAFKLTKIATRFWFKYVVLNMVT